MIHKITRNWPLKLLSILFAFIIWTLVANLDNPTKSKLFRDVKIQIINEDSVTEIDKAVDIVSDDTVVIKVTERRRILENLSSSDFTVVADMENLTEMNTVPLTVVCSNSAVTLDEMTIYPASLKVELEQIVQKDYVVSVDISGTPANGYEVGTTEILEGRNIQIAGPESLLEKIGQVTANVAVNGISTNQRVSAELSVTDKNGDSFSDTQMSRLKIMDSTGVLLSDNNVTVSIVLWEVLYDVDIEADTIGTPEHGYDIVGVSTLPDSVNLTGTAEALKAIDGKIVIAYPIPAAGATETFSVEVNLDDTIGQLENVRLAEGIDPVITVTVQVEKSGDQTIMVPLSELTVLNRPENMVLTFSPADLLSVSVRSEDENRKIELSDINAVIDLSECSKEGDYEIPVEIELPEGFMLVSDVSLMVNASKPEQIEQMTED